MGEVLAGDVLKWADGRWRIVLAARAQTPHIAVTDRRTTSASYQRPPTFGPGSRPYQRPTEEPSPHTVTISGRWR